MMEEQAFVRRERLKRTLCILPKEKKKRKKKTLLEPHQASDLSCVDALRDTVLYTHLGRLLVKKAGMWASPHTGNGVGSGILKRLKEIQSCLQ